jgi:hypothetical protein
MTASLYALRIILKDIPTSDFKHENLRLYTLFTMFLINTIFFRGIIHIYLINRCKILHSKLFLNDDG